MKTENTIIIHPETTEQENALKAFAKALKMKFEVSRGKPYDPEFEAKIKRSEKEFEEGNFTRVEKDDLKNLLGL